MDFRNCFFLRIIVLTTFFLPCAAIVSCAPEARGRAVLMEWNTEAFFDATETGSEFKEYRGAKSAWSKSRYAVRLDRLKETLLLAGERSGKGRDRGPDIVVLEEIENAQVLRDLCNRLPRLCCYPYAAFSPPGKDSAFGSAILSRYPIRSVTVHSVAGLADDGSRFGDWSSSSVALRPLLEATIDIGGIPLIVFAEHWKSKSGRGESASIRLAQERLLLARINAIGEKSPGVHWVACGDFNQRPEEFTSLTGFTNCWTNWLASCESAGVSGPPGSYWFRGNWDAIDHIIYSPVVTGPDRFSLADFRVLAEPPLTGSDGIPARYEVFSGAGYSDHLPLLATFFVGK
jgi:endonuclease/exonuclease/phosphatase family metal-dependent hydrolase